MIQIDGNRAIVGIPKAGSSYIGTDGQRYQFTGASRDSGMMRLYESAHGVVFRWWTLREYQCDRAKKILQGRGKR